MTVGWSDVTPNCDLLRTRNVFGLNGIEGFLICLPIAVTYDDEKREMNQGSPLFVRGDNPRKGRNGGILWQ